MLHHCYSCLRTRGVGPAKQMLWYDLVELHYIRPADCGAGSTTVSSAASGTCSLEWNSMVSACGRALARDLTGGWQ